MSLGGKRCHIKPAETDRQLGFMASFRVFLFYFFTGVTSGSVHFRASKEPKGCVWVSKKNIMQSRYTAFYLLIKYSH